MVSLIFLVINLLSLSIVFFWSQLKLWSASQQFLAISFLLQSLDTSKLAAKFDLVSFKAEVDKIDIDR